MFKKFEGFKNPTAGSKSYGNLADWADFALHWEGSSPAVCAAGLSCMFAFFCIFNNMIVWVES